MYYLHFCTVGPFTPFTNFHIFNKDVYPENTTLIEIEKNAEVPAGGFRHFEHIGDSKN